MAYEAMFATDITDTASSPVKPIHVATLGAENQGVKKQLNLYGHSGANGDKGIPPPPPQYLAPSWI
jgi:hypothetical protein